MEPSEKSIRRCGASSFEIFYEPPFLGNVRESKINEVAPNLPVPFSITNADTVLRYSIPRSSNKWICNQFFIHARVKITKGDGTDIPADRNCSFIANFLNSWDKIVVSLNSKETYTCNQYGFISYFTTLLLQPKSEHLRKNDTEKLWFDESAVNVIASNSGWNARSQLCAGSSLVEMFGELNIPCFNGSRYIPPDIQLDFTLYSYSPSFLIQASSATENWKLQFIQCFLRYQSIEVSDDFLHQYKLLFDRGNYAKLLFYDYRSFMVNLRAGTQDLSTPQFQLASQPRRIFIGFVRETAYIGTYTTTPYEFAHNDVRSIKLKIGETILQQSINPGQDYYAEMLFWMQRNCGWRNHPGNFGVSLTNPDTATNNNLFVFDCTNSMTASCQEFYSINPKSTVFSVEAVFGTALPHNLVAIILCELDAILSVASDREASINYPSHDD